jgi:hypothetical protein
VKSIGICSKLPCSAAASKSTDRPPTCLSGIVRAAFDVNRCNFRRAFELGVVEVLGERQLGDGERLEHGVFLEVDWRVRWRPAVASRMEIDGDERESARLLPS